MKNAVNLNLEKVNEQEFKVITSNGLNIGTFELDVDGFWHFWNTDYIAGSWSSYSLRLVADKLDEVNKPYKEVVDEYFDQERRDREERARVEYRKLLNESGMFFEFYPHLTGDWKKDKLEWFDIYKELEDLRAKNTSF